MPISSRQFFNTKPIVIEYMTLELYHPAFGTLRYVRDQYFEKTIAGEVYQPAFMNIKETLQDERNTVSYEIQLGRIGTQVKAMTKQIDNMPFGWMTPVDSIVKYWLSDDLTTPYRPPVELSVGNLAMDADNVAITLDTSNPRGQSVARRYNGDDFPGTNAKL